MWESLANCGLTKPVLSLPEALTTNRFERKPFALSLSKGNFSQNKFVFQRFGNTP